jgi:hypothetical protein
VVLPWGETVFGLSPKKNAPSFSSGAVKWDYPGLERMNKEN